VPEVEVETAVVGAGAAGLAAALELRRAGVEVVLLEAGGRPGGVMQTEEIRGHRVERGPNTCLVRAPALAFLQAQGFERELVAASPARRLRFVFHEGRLEPVPMGPLGFVRSPLLTTRGKLRLLAEPWVQRGDAGTESAQDFIARRFGPEVAEKLLAPALTGIYAGDERELGARAVLGFATELERTHEAERARALADLIDRLSARLGQRAVTRRELVEAHLPEQAERAAPATLGEARRRGEGDEPVAPQGAPPARPLRIFARPEPIDALSEVPDGPPLRFRWRRVLHDVAAIEGPERIAAPWWRRPDAPTRDYFRAEDSHGRRFWLYREGLWGRETERAKWFVHGVFG